jgi:hypothetical protein
MVVDPLVLVLMVIAYGVLLWAIGVIEARKE